MGASGRGFDSGFYDSLGVQFVGCGKWCTASPSMVNLRQQCLKTLSAELWFDGAPTRQ